MEEVTTKADEFSTAYERFSDCADIDPSCDSTSISDGPIEMRGIHCEYQPKQDLSGDHTYEEQEGDWRQGRPSFFKSLGLCFLYSFYTTILAGIPAGLISVLLTWLDLNFAEACSSYNNKWNKMPITVRRISLTAQVVEGMMLQFWSFTALLFMFEMRQVNDMNIPIWNVLAAALDAIYRLFLSVYGLYNRTWMTYPLNILFICIACFNYYRITAHFERGVFARIKLALKFGSAFWFGTPMYLFMAYLLLPVYKDTHNDLHKAIISAVLPVAFVIPKAIINVCLVDASKYYDAGRLGIVIVGFQTMASIIARYLQANVETTGIFIALCFIHGFENFIDKLTWKLRNRAYRFFFSSCVSKDKPEQQASLSRLQADASLSGIILETDTILMSCALVAIFSYSYDTKLSSADVVVKEFLLRITVSCVIEWVFNALAIKVQTYYYNIPVMLVWKRKWHWIIAGILTNTVFIMVYCSEHLYEAVVTFERFNSTVVAECRKPFQDPHT